MDVQALLQKKLKLSDEAGNKIYFPTLWGVLLKLMSFNWAFCAASRHLEAIQLAQSWVQCRHV
jgi:hypothetical protein